MSITTLATFFKVVNAADGSEQLYQNAKRDDVSESLDDGSGGYVKQTANFIMHKEEAYYYLPFIYQGAAKNRNGDNLEAQLVLANNQLAMNRARDAVKNRWNIEISVCVVEPVNLTPTRTLTIDHWLVASFSYDATTIEILLSSAIDAVGSTSPNRVLTSSMVGALPTSATIQNL